VKKAIPKISKFASNLTVAAFRTMEMQDRILAQRGLS